MRVTLEWALRAVSLVLIAWMVWLSSGTVEGGAVVGRHTSGSPSLRDSLVAWTLDAPVDSLHAMLDELPGVVERDWMAALRRAGSHVSWASRSLIPLALSVEPLDEPAGGIRTLIAAPPGARVIVSDALGLMDTVAMTRPTIELRARAVRGAVRASPGGGARAASGTELVSLEPRGVVVLGGADWESKFVVAALEESGWDLSARLAVAPGVDVLHGSIRLDTSVTAVVVALDSTAAREARGIDRFVREGGGLVLAGDAARSPAFALLAAGRVEGRVKAATISFTDSAPRRALGFYSIGAPVHDAVALESRDGVLVAAARRVGPGRVVQVGYDETWRWRLQGGGGSPEAHRAWWSAVVGGAGYRASRGMKVDRASLDPSPVASTFAALGQPTTLGLSATPSATRPALRRWMLLLLFAVLLTEWASRRLRGVR